MSIQHFLTDTTGQRFSAASLVQMIVTETREAVLLDLQTDRFFGIDQMGLLIWTLFTEGHTFQEVVHLITEHYIIETEESLQKDVLQFLKQMQEQHLLLPTQNIFLAKKASPHDLVWPSLSRLPASLFLHFAQMSWKVYRSEWLEAWFLLRWVYKFLQHGKLIDLSKRLHALPTKRLVTYESSDVRRLATCIQSAACWQPFQAVCLSQNLALGFMLRQREIQADLVIGVSTFPFFAHAWLQSGLEVIHWETGLGPGASLQRLHELSIIFCSGCISDEDKRNGETS